MSGAHGSQRDQDHLAKSATATLVNNATIFNVDGEIQIISLHAMCMTDNDATASTLQFKAVPDVGASTTISGVSASLANLTAGAVVVMAGAALATAPIIGAAGISLNTTPRGVIVPTGTIAINVGVGPTTGAWHFHLRYEPLEEGASVS